MGGVAGGVGAEQVGVAGEGFAGLAVDQETDLLDLRDVGVERADDGEKGEGFDFDAGGVGVDEAAAEVDDGELATGGYVDRTPDARDGRRDFVTLTVKARGLLTDYLANVDSCLTDLLSNDTPVSASARSGG